MISGAVIGRDAELEFVQAFLDALDGGPAGLVLSGESGIGKTILWQAGVEEPPLAGNQFHAIVNHMFPSGPTAIPVSPTVSLGTPCHPGSGYSLI